MSMIVKKVGKDSGPAEYMPILLQNGPWCWWQMRGGYTGEDYCCLVFLLLNLSDYSCEKQFRIKNGIIEYRNIFIVLCTSTIWISCLIDDPSTHLLCLLSVSRKHVSLDNCFNTFHLIILSSVFRQSALFTWHRVNLVNYLKTLSDHLIPSPTVSTSIVWRPLILSSYPTPLAESTWTWT